MPPLATDIRHLPFGPVKSLTYGNGLTLERRHDLDYRRTAQTVGDAQRLAYAHGAAGNLQAITDALDPAASEAYGYDELGRLVSAQGRYGRLAYAYDATGNRVADWRDGAETRYTYDPASQKLLSLSGARVDTFAYDANGNTVLAGGRELAYAPDQRLSAVRRGGADIARHRYDADGWRAGKAAAGADAAYAYGPDGRLLEDGGAGAYHAWLDGEPLARLPYYRPGSRRGAVLDVLYYHNTPSGTPHTATDKAGRVAWKANAEPFGRMSPSGPAVQNLRFPGQWFDAEDGLHYNMARYYDSALGRYLQADRIGLAGGANLYAYAENDPVNLTDPTGNCPVCLLAVPLLLEAWNIYDTANDIADTAKVLGDRCASTGDKLEAVGSLALGMVDPTPGNVGKKLARSATIFQSVGAAVNRVIDFSNSKSLMKAFDKHGADFGFSGGPTKANLQAFSESLARHTADEGTMVIQGTYRGAMDVTHFYNPTTGLNVMRDSDGVFVSGWRLNPAQAKNVIERGTL